MDIKLRPGDLCQDKDGVRYQVAAVAEHAETGERLVICQCMEGDFRVLAIPVRLFDGKMEAVSGSGEEKPAVCPGTGEQTSPGREAAGLEGTGRDTAGQESPDAPFNPLILDFAEETDYGRRLDLFRKMKGNLTQKELDILYEILDLFRKSGDLSQQEDAVESYLKMQKKFDGARLR